MALSSLYTPLLMRPRFNDKSSFWLAVISNLQLDFHYSLPHKPVAWRVGTFLMPDALSAAAIYNTVTVVGKFGLRQ